MFRHPIYCLVSLYHTCYSRCYSPLFCPPKIITKLYSPNMTSVKLFKLQSSCRQIISNFYTSQASRNFESLENGKFSVAWYIICHYSRHISEEIHSVHNRLTKTFSTFNHQLYLIPLQKMFWTLSEKCKSQELLLKRESVFYYYTNTLLATAQDLSIINTILQSLKNIL